MKLENVLFKKIEIWAVLIFAIVGIVCALLFAWSVRHYHVGGERLGSLGPIIDSIAGFPGIVKRVLINPSGKDDLLAVEQRFGEESGFKFNYSPSSRPDLGYILVNRYDGDLEFSVSELWDLNSQEKVHTWRFSGVDRIWKESNFANLPVDAAAHRFRGAHTLLTENADVFLHSFDSPVIQSDACSSLKLFNDKSIYHHSVERDSNSNLWVPKRINPKTVEIGGVNFADDGIAQISPNGDVLFEKSVTQLLDDNGLGYLVYGKGVANDDPIHLNDIEPVLKDGILWKQGDVFLSLRHQSMIVLYRPSTNKVVWYQQGPWMHQHDVDVINDHEISVFNNNAAVSNKSGWTVRGVNNVLIYDFATSTVRSPWQAGFEKLNIRTKTEGLGDVLGQEVFVEESNYGRLIQFSPEGAVAWQFINRAKDGKVYILNWSRRISRELGDNVRSVISRKRCS